MEPRGLLSLPVELIHLISSYLSVEDVLSCSLTCHYLRNTLNDDYVWREYLPKQDLSSLKDLEHHVSPGFEEDKSLCTNKSLYARKTNLINNWKSGNYVIDRERTIPMAMGYSNRCLKRMLLYKNSYIFIVRFGGIGSDNIEVWDMEKIPTCKYTILPLVKKNYDSFYIIDSYLIAVEGDKVYVYQISLPEKSFPLVYSFIITNENVDLTINDHVQQTGPICIDWYHSTVGKFLLSNKYDENDLHVWDILSGSKVGSFVSPIDSSSIRLQSYNGNDWLLVHTLKVGSNRVYLNFNVETQKCSIVFSYQGHHLHRIMLYDDVRSKIKRIIVFDSAEDSSQEWGDTMCRIFDLNTSKELKNRRFNTSGTNPNYDSTKIVNGKFVILCQNLFQIINALNLETVDYITCDGSYYCLREVNVFGSIFLLTVHNITNKIDVWDIKAKRRFPIGSFNLLTCYLSITDSCTKFVFVRIDYADITVFHFW